LLGLLAGITTSTYGGYEAGREYRLLQCKTDAVFDQRRREDERWTPSHNPAEVAARFSNLVSTFGKPLIKIGFGVALSGISGGGLPGAIAGFGAATVGLIYGAATCPCPEVSP
jgi:hypothetical protein